MLLASSRAVICYIVVCTVSADTKRLRCCSAPDRSVPSLTLLIIKTVHTGMGPSGAERGVCCCTCPMLLFVEIADSPSDVRRAPLAPSHATTLYLDNCQSMLIVFINIPFYTNRICDEFIVGLCEAASSAVGSYCRSGPRARTFHLADRVFYWCQYYFVIRVLSRQLYFLIYTCYPAGIVLYYICLKAEYVPSMRKAFFVNIARVGIY